MKRLIREPIVADESLVTKITRFIDSLFNGVEKSLSIIESWGSNESNEDAPPAEKDDPNHIVLKVLPAGDVEDWGKGPIFKMLVKQIDENDRYITIRFDIKAPTGESATDTATLDVQGEDESDADYGDRVEQMLYTMGGKLLEACTKDMDVKYDQIADLAEV